MLFSVNLTRTFPSHKLQLSFGFQASLLLAHVFMQPEPLVFGFSETLTVGKVKQFSG